MRTTNLALKSFTAAGLYEMRVVDVDTGLNVVTFSNSNTDPEMFILSTLNWGVSESNMHNIEIQIKGTDVCIEAMTFNSGV